MSRIALTDSRCALSINELPIGVYYNDISVLCAEN